MNEGDQNSKYFHIVIKGRQAKIKTVSIQNDECAILTYESSICSEFLKFYNAFLGTASSDCIGGSEDFLHSLQLASLSNETQLSLLKEVTAEEIYSTLKRMPCNNLLGPDGYIMEFFLLAWQVIGPLFTVAIQEFFTFGQLLKQINATAIALVPKVS